MCPIKKKYNLLMRDNNIILNIYIYMKHYFIITFFSKINYYLQYILASKFRLSSFDE